MLNYETPQGFYIFVICKNYQISIDLLINQIPLFPDVKSENDFETPLTKGKEVKSF